MKQGPIIKNKFKLIVVISYDTTILNKLYLIIKKPQVPEKVMYRIIIKKYFIRILSNQTIANNVSGHIIDFLGIIIYVTAVKIKI